VAVRYLLESWHPSGRQNPCWDDLSRSVPWTLWEKCSLEGANYARKEAQIARLLECAASASLRNSPAIRFASIFSLASLIGIGPRVCAGSMAPPLGAWYFFADSGRATDVNALQATFEDARAP
jgi:hypothetical protein